MFNWEDGNLIEPAYVEINGQKHYVTPAKYRGDTPITASNLNKMQNYILGDLKTVGTLEINEGINPSSYLPGIWEKQKMFLGGELIAFGAIKNGSTNTEHIPKTDVISISNEKIPNKKYDVTNYMDNILEYNLGAFLVRPKNIVGMIEAELCLAGNIGTGCTGLWFKANQNPLPEGVSLLQGDGPILSTYGSYSGAMNKYIYKIDDEKIFGDEESFYINPGAQPYNGSFAPTCGGVQCYLAVKVFAKKGMTIWKRVS